MKVKIKNCGLKTPEAIHEAAKTGASFAGFIHHPPSPRHLTLEAITDLTQQMPPTLAQVLVLVDPSDTLLTDIQRRFRPNYLQLHNVREPKRIQAIAAATGIPIITAISVQTKDDLANATALEAVNAHLLLDSAQFGSGQSFDWSMLAGLALKKPWFLAGGLTPQNVAEALRLTKAPMVDVSSGIEDMPGVKSLEKIAAFNKAVLNAPDA